MFIVLGIDEKEYGPVSSGQVRAWIMDGRANLQTKAKLHDANEWKTLGDFAEFGGGSISPTAAAPVAAPPPVPVTAPVAPLAWTSEKQPASASRWLRLPAALIDGLLKVACLLPMTLPLSRALYHEAEFGTTASFLEVCRKAGDILEANFNQALPLLGALFLIQLGLLAYRGQSIGKLALGLVIVRWPDAEPAGFVRAGVLRSIVPFVLEQVPVLGVIFWVVDTGFIFRDDRRCLHDLLAGTFVVHA